MGGVVILQRIEKSSEFRWVVLVLTWTAFLVTWIFRSGYPPLIPEMMQSLQMSSLQAGTLSTGFWIGYFCMQLPSGALSDVIGVKKIWVIALLSMGPLCFITGLTNTYTNVLIVFVVNGILAGFISAPCIATLRRFFPSRERAMAIGLFLSASVVGMTSFTIISPIISSSFGSWTWVFSLLSSLPITVGLLIFGLYKEPKSALSPQNSQEKLNLKLLVQSTFVFKNKWLWLLLAARWAALLAYSGIATWIPTYLIVEGGFTATNAGIIAALYSAIGIVSMPLAGIAAGKLTRRTPLVLLLLACSSVGFFAFANSNLNDMSSLYVSILIAGFFSASWDPTVLNLISTMPPANLTGTVVGLSNFIGLSGAAVGPVVFAFILEATHNYQTSFLSIVAISLISVLAIIPVMWAEVKNAQALSCK